MSATNAPTSFSSSGLSSYGLFINASGLITGTPTNAAANVAVPVTATNAFGTSAQATITLNHLAYEFPLRVLAPAGRAQRQSLARIPSLLGRDILSNFALFLEQRTERVLLLEPHEAAALQVP